MKWPKEWLNAITDEVVGPEHREARGAQDSAARILDALFKAGVVCDPTGARSLLVDAAVFSKMVNALGNALPFLLDAKPSVAEQVQAALNASMAAPIPRG